MDDLISRQAAIDAMMRLQEEDEEIYGCMIPEGFDGDRAKESLEQLPSAQPDIAEKLYLCKCCVTDEEGLQHEVIHTGDIRRITGWEI